jgi:hypothetical protein
MGGLARYAATFACLAAVGVACKRAGGVPYPLYPAAEPAPAPDQIATLAGPIGSVVGREVGDKGRTFSLLPGCHVVVLRRDVGGAGEGGAWSAHLSRIVCAFKMRGGRRYSVEIRTDDSTGPVGHFTIKAFERDAAGAATQLPAATSQEQIEDCMAWRPEGAG